MHEYRRFVQEQLDRHGWTPGGFARMAGMHRQTISKIVNDDRDHIGQMPDESTLQGIADGFKIDVRLVREAAARSLVGYVEPKAMVGVEDFKQRSRARYEAMTPEEREAAAADADFIEQAFTESRERAARERVAVDNSRHGRLLEARATPPEERTPDQWDIILAAEARRERDAASARRSVDEEPLVDLVDEGQILAAMKDDEDVNAYVRRVESAVVGLMGIDRLMVGLDWRASTRLASRAHAAGVTVQFVDEINRLRESGVDPREVTRLMATKLDEIIADPPPLTLAQQAGQLGPVDFDEVVWEPARQMVININDKLEMSILEGEGLAEYRIAVSELESELAAEAGVRRYMILADRMARTAGREIEVFDLMGNGPARLVQGLALTNQGLRFSGQEPENSTRPAVVDETEALAPPAWNTGEPPSMGDDKDRRKSN